MNVEKCIEKMDIVAGCGALRIKICAYTAHIWKDITLSRNGSTRQIHLSVVVAMAGYFTLVCLCRLSHCFIRSHSTDSFYVETLKLAFSNIQRSISFHPYGL